MSERVTNILGYTTLIAILAAIWVMFGEDPARDQGARGENTFAGLADRINETHKVSLQQGEFAATLTLEDGVWRIAERGGYPAVTEKIHAFLKGVALSKRREPKTSNESRFDRLGLGADAVVVDLQDDTGGSLRTFKMGKRSSNASGRSLTYIMQATDTRSWLVTGLSEAPADPAWWLDKRVLDIDAARIRDITIGDAWITRKPGDSDYTLQSLRPDETVGPTWKLAEPARVIKSLSLTDVKQLNNPLVDPTGKVELATYDGLTISLTLYTMDGGTWAQVAAAFDDEMRNDGASGELKGAPEDGAGEAAALQAKVHGWVFKLSDSDSSALLKSRQDFLEVKSE